MRRDLQGPTGLSRAAQRAELAEMSCGHAPPNSEPPRTTPLRLRTTPLWLRSKSSRLRSTSLSLRSKSSRLRSGAGSLRSGAGKLRSTSSRLPVGRPTRRRPGKALPASAEPSAPHLRGPGPSRLGRSLRRGWIRPRNGRSLTHGGRKGPWNVMLFRAGDPQCKLLQRWKRSPAPSWCQRRFAEHGPRSSGSFRFRATRPRSETSRSVHQSSRISNWSKTHFGSACGQLDSLKDCSKWVSPRCPQPQVSRCLGIACETWPEP